LVQFLFSFVLYSLSYIYIKKEERKIKIEPRKKSNHNIYIKEMMLKKPGQKNNLKVVF